MNPIRIAIAMILFLTTVNCQRNSASSNQTSLQDSNTVNSQVYDANGKEAVIDLFKEINSKDIHRIELYKINLANSCNQSKAISIVFRNKIAPCFDYRKTLKGKEKDNFIRIIRDHHTYRGEDVACFDTDYGLLLYGHQNEIVGYINISKSCNKLISNPEIKEMTYYAHDGLRLIGFSKNGRKSIEKALGI